MFLLYINDLPECLLNTTSGMYADDTQIYASSASFSETFKILNNHSAPNLRDKFNIRNTNLGSYNLRNTDINLSIPKPNTEYLERSFGYSSAVRWNSLPTQAKQTESLTIFKNLIY